MKKIIILMVIMTILSLTFAPGICTLASTQSTDGSRNNNGKEESKDLNAEQITKRINKFFEVIGELKVKVSNLADFKLKNKVNKILTEVETKVLSIKQSLAKVDAGNEEELARANDVLDKLKALIKKAEALLEDEEMDEKLDIKDLDKFIADVEKKLEHLGKQITHIQGKINSRETKGKNVKDIQSLLEEVKNSFGEAGEMLSEAKAAYGKGDMEKASAQICAAVSASKLAKRLLEKIDFGKMQNKDNDKQEGKLSVYDELIWKVKHFMEMIGEIRAAATGLDNEKKILTSLSKAEKRIQAIYEEILSIGPSGTEDQFEFLDDDLEAIKRAVKKTNALVKEGKEDIEDDVLRTEEAKKSAEDILERAEVRYKKFLKIYNAKENKLLNDSGATIKDLLEQAKTNLNTAQTYFDQENYDNAQSYGYSSLVISNTGIKLLQ